MAFSRQNPRYFTDFEDTGDTQLSGPSFDLPNVTSPIDTSSLSKIPDINNFSGLNLDFTQPTTLNNVTNTDTNVTNLGTGMTGLGTIEPTFRTNTRNNVILDGGGGGFDTVLDTFTPTTFDTFTPTVDTTTTTVGPSGLDLVSTFDTTGTSTGPSTTDITQDTVGGATTTDTVGGATTVDTVGGATTVDTTGGADAADTISNITTADTTGGSASTGTASGTAGGLSQTAESQTTATTGPTGGLEQASTIATTGATGALTTAVTGAAEPKKEDLVYDYEGTGYDKVELLNLANQIAPNITQLAGGAFSTKGESIGFDYDVAKQLLGGEPTAAQQVVLDMARNMLKMGIKDISQLNVKDIRQDLEVHEIYDDNGRPTGRYYTEIQDPFNPEKVITRELTPEEAAKIRTETTQTTEGDQIRRFAEDVLTGKGLYSGDKLITQTNQLIDKLSMDVGATYTGKDATKYALVINPTTGKPEFMTYMSSTSDMDKVNAALTMASFIPGINVFAKAAQAILAIRNGDVLGGLAALAGARGYADIATALNVAKAAQNGDALGIVRGLLDNPTIAGAAGGIKLEGNITLADVGNGLNLIAALENKNWAAALTYAGSLTNSQDLKTAGAATRVIAAVNSGNPMAVADAVMGLDKVIQAGNKVNDPTVATNIANRVQNTQVASVSSNITGTATDAVGDAPYTGVTGPTGGLTVAAGDVNAEDTIDRSGELTGLGALTGVTGATGATTGADVNAGAPLNYATFGEAFNAARELNYNLTGQKGGGTFTWEDPVTGETKTYSTSTADEKTQEDLTKQADLSFSKDRLPLAANSFLSNAASQPALYNPLGLSPTELMDQFDRFANATPEQRAQMLAGSGGQMFTLMANSITSKAGIDPVTGLSTAPKITTTKDSSILDTVGHFASSAGAELVGAAAGVANALGLSERGGELDQAAKILSQQADESMPDSVRAQKVEFENAIKNAKNAGEVLKIIAASPFNQPLYVGSLVASEIIQELGTLMASGGVLTAAKMAGVANSIALKLGIGTDIVLNALESGGSAAQDAYQRTQNELASKVRSGEMTQAQADAQAQEASQKALALGSVMTTGLMMAPGGNALTKQIFGNKGTADSAASVIAKTTAKETVVEGLEGSSIEAGTQKIVNADKALDTKGVAFQGGMSSLITVGTVGSIASVTTNINTLDNSLMSSGASQADLSAIRNDISTALSGGATVTEVKQNIVEYLATDLNMSNEEASQVADDMISNQAILNFATSLDSAGLDEAQSSQVASEVNKVINSNTDVQTQVQNTTKILSDAGVDQTTIQQINNSLFPGATTGTAATTGTTTAADTTTTTKGDVTTTTATDANNNTTTQTEVNSNTGTTTETTTNNNTNTTTQTETNPNNNTTTTTETNNNTNVTTQTETNNNTNTTTQTETNNNTNVTTQTETNNNTNVTTQTETNNNTNVTTQTTVNNNTGVTTDTTTDTNGNVTTEVTTDPNNNTETTTTYNPDNNTSTTTTVNTETSEVIDTETKTNVVPPTIDPVEPPDKVDPLKPTPPTETKTPTPKLPKTLSTPEIAALFGAPELADYALPLMGLSPDIKLFTTLQEGQTGVPLSQIAPIEQKQALTDEEIEAILEERRMERERANREAMMRELGYYEEGNQDYRDPGYAEGGLVDHHPEFFSEGGASLANRYVKGDGDGTSDSVPAMLASGEFVIPADVVSSLGNGDNDAGAQALDQFLRTIREHKRNADPSELPEDSKGPLVYLEEALVKVRRKNGRTK